MIRKIALGTLAVLALVIVVALALVGSQYESYPATDSAVATAIPATPLSADTRAQISDFLTAYRAEHGLPSISAAVGTNGRLAYAAAVGYADLVSRTPATPASLYRIGSVSKSITAVVMGRLMEAGEMDIDTPFSHYLPGFPDKAWPFTPRQLASHTAGIRHYRPGFFASLEESYHDVHYQRVVDSLVLVENDPLLFEPGTAYSYSSYGYNMLSAAMVAASGVPFTEQLQHHVFDPVGMVTARAEDARNPHPDTVGYYVNAGGRNFRSPDTDNSYKIAGGGIIATPSELVTFGNALLAGKLVNADTMATLFTPVPLRDGSTEPQNYGLGFRTGTREIDGQPRMGVGHGGSSVGGLTAFTMYPETGLVIAVTTNISPLATEGGAYGVADGIADLLIPMLAER
jgi:CubicO group peptidase (beta-lactamase class C family)